MTKKFDNEKTNFILAIKGVMRRIFVYGGFLAVLLGLLISTGGLTGKFSRKPTPVYKPRDGEELKKPGLWNGAARYYWMVRSNAITGEIEVEDITSTWQKIKNGFAMAKSSAPSFVWDFACCNNIGGRTRAIWWNPNNPNIMLAGSVSGGLYRSTDGGNTWTRIDLDPPNAIVSYITHGPDGTVYVGTGSSFDAYGNLKSVLFPGYGIYRSLDGLNASKFEHIPSTAPAPGSWPPNTTTDVWSAVNAIAVHPSNPSVIFAGTHRGIRVSTDGGNTWTNPISPNTGICDQLKITPDGKFLYWFQGTRFYVWRNPPDDPANNIKSYTTGSATGRINFDFSPSAYHIIWLAAVQSGSACFDGLYRSTDTGKTWQLIAPNNQSIGFTPCSSGGQCQGVYDLAIAVDPDNPNKVFLGCVSLWQYDGNLTMIALPGGGGYSSTGVHVDNHFLGLQPYGSTKALVVGTDGGIYKGYPISGAPFLYAYTNFNKDYLSLQCYGVTYTPHGFVACGSQDNGTNIQIFENEPVNGLHILGGDGFDCDISFIARNPSYMFGTIYTGQIYRLAFNGYFNYDRNNPPGVASITCQTSTTQNTCQSAPFYTPIRLWETINDYLSRDTIVFVNATDSVIIGGGDGITRKFNGVVFKRQPQAKFVQGSISFYSGTQSLTDVDGDGILTGDGTGTFNYTTGEYDIQFNIAPSPNSPIYAKFDTKFDAGDTLFLLSENGNYPVTHVLGSTLLPGDTAKIQDRVQAMLAWGASNKVLINRHAIKSSSRFNNTVIDSAWIPIPISGVVTTLAWSSDGNILYVGTQFSGLYRIKGLRNLFSTADLSNLSVTKIFSTSSSIEGIGVHPQNPDLVVIGLANYGLPNNVYMATNAASSSGLANFVSIQGNLPPMPVYAAIFMLDSANTILVGTDYGVWKTSQPAGNATQWTPLTEVNFNGTILKGFVPVFDIKQITYSHPLTYRRGEIVVGSHGLGMWRWTPPGISPVGISETSRSEHSGITGSLQIFPNPASTYITLLIPASFIPYEIIINSISGQSIKREQINSRNERITLDIKDLQRGMYLITVKASSGKTLYGRFLKQ